MLQRKAASDHDAGEVPNIVYDVLRSPGQPLDAESRSYFEPRFGYDFSRVRVHSNSSAARSASAVDAEAFTVGSNIVFSQGSYSPRTRNGRELMAHELTHVIQQGFTNASSSNLAVSDADSRAEREATVLARRATQELRSEQYQPVSVNGEVTLSRKPTTETKPASKHIVVDIGSQTATAYEGGKESRTMKISSGRKGYPTPTGPFTVGDPDKTHKSSKYGKCVGPEGSRNVGNGAKSCRKSEKYVGADMGYYQPFAPAVGFHRGDPAVMSHGCIHLAESDAKWLWDWAGKGTSVQVKGAPSKEKAPVKSKRSKKKSSQTTSLHGVSLKTESEPLIADAVAFQQTADAMMDTDDDADVVDSTLELEVDYA